MATIYGLRGECETALKRCGDFVMDFRGFCEEATRKAHGNVTIAPVDADDRHYQHIGMIDTIEPSDAYGVVFSDSRSEGTEWGVGDLHLTTMLAIAEGIQEAMGKH